LIVGFFVREDRVSRVCYGDRTKQEHTNKTQTINKRLYKIKIIAGIVSETQSIACKNATLCCKNATIPAKLVAGRKIYISRLVRTDTQRQRL
jgi:hypothetical protein